MTGRCHGCAGTGVVIIPGRIENKAVVHDPRLIACGFCPAGTDVLRAQIQNGVGH